jgi:hypothetical protein
VEQRVVEVVVAMDHARRGRGGSLVEQPAADPIEQRQFAHAFSRSAP